MDNLFLQTQVDTFNRYLRNEINADVITSSLRTLLDIINTEYNTSKIDLILEIIFHPDAGLLSFVRQIKNADHVTIEVINTSFDLLDCMLKDFGKSIEKYAFDIFDTCTICIFWAKSSNVKIRSYVTTRLLVKNYINTFQEHANKLEQLLSKLILQTESHLPSLDKKNNYALISAILKHYPAIVPQSTKYKLFRKLKVDLKSSLPKSKPTELEGLFKCLISFLRSFQEIVVPEDSELYSIVKDGCNLDSYRRTSIRVAFKVIRNNFDLFTENIYNDCEWWYNKLEEFLNSVTKNDYIIAFKVLNVFYEKVAKVIKEKSSENDKRILRFFVNKLKEDIQSGDSRKISLAMKNLGYFSEACKVHDEIAELEGIFTLTAQLTEKYSAGITDDNVEVHNLSDLLLTVTEIAKSYSTEDLGEDKLDVLKKLTVFVITSYPNVSFSFQIRVKQSLLTSVYNVAMIGETILDSYLDKLMFISLIRCCSHLMESDVELLKTVSYIDSDELVSFKNYVSLWCDICRIDNIPYDSSSSNFGKIQFELRMKKVDNKLFDKFITAALSIIEKLDFSVTEEEPDNKLLMNSVEYSLKLNKESDFYIFMNLVELLSSVIQESDADMFENWLPHLTAVFIQYATSCPIKTGFYNLLDKIFQKSGSTFNFIEYTDVQQLNSFLCHVITHIQELKGTELISCLRMIMNSPACSIQHISPHIISLFQIVFTLGLEDLELAEEGLNSLEKWYIFLPRENFEPVLLSVIPCLVPYMQSKKFAGDTDVLTESEKRLLIPVFTQSRNKNYKKFREACATSMNSKLSKLQRKIVKFLSKVDTELCSSFYRSQNCSTFEPTEILKFELPFTDMKVKIFLDKFLPRAMELACNSSDLKTRIVACEVLHSITTVFVGNSNHLEHTFPKPAQNLFKYILLCVFKLGADNNTVVKQLFHPFCVQLTHYYSSKLQNRSSITDTFLETLFNCISNNNDTSLRHFTAEMVGEFVVSAIRSARNEIDVHSSPNILAVIKRICLFCVLPCNFKRLGAALVFNCTYRALREELELVNVYWIELLFHFVKNLSLNSDGDCNNKHSSEALDHINRVLLEKFELFKENHAFRRVPNGLEGGTLNDVLLWLFPFCLSQNKLCRSKCMELISTLTSILPGYGSLKYYFNSLNCERRNRILEIIFFNCAHRDRNLIMTHDMNQKSDNGTHPVEHIKRIINQLKSLLSSYHCLFWLLKEEAVSFFCLQSNTSFLDSIKNFNEFILPVDLKTYICTNFRSVTCDLFYITDFESSFKSLKQQVFFQILEILTVLNKHTELFIGEEVFQYNLWNSFIVCLFEPSQFAAGVLSNENISDLVLKVLICLRRVSDKKLKLISSKIKEFPSKTLFWDSVMNLSNNTEIIDLQSRQYLNGLFILEKAEWLTSVVDNMAVQKEQIIANIFRSLSHNQNVLKYKSTVFLYVEDLLRFSLINIQIDKVMNLVYISDILVYKETSSTITHGRYFFVTFKKPIIEYLNRHQQYLILTCLKNPHTITKQNILIIADCLAFAAELKQKMNFDDLVVGIFENWSTLSQWIALNSNCISHVLSIIGNSVNSYKKLTNCNMKNLSMVFHWLLDRLIDQITSTLLKKQILDLLPPFISEEIEEYDQHIFSVTLRDFQSQYFSPTDNCQIKTAEYVLLFNSILTLLNGSSNTIVLKYVIYIHAFNYMSVSEKNIEKTLINLMHANSPEHQLKMLMVPYQIFKIESHNVEFKLHCIQFFLIPLLNLASADAAQKFFISEFSFMLQTLKIQISNNSAKEIEENIIGKQIVTTLLVETYCNVISDFDCSEVRQAVYSNESTVLRKEVSKMFLEIITKQVSLTSSANESLLRKLKCYAYNTLMKIISKVQREEKFYKILFSKNIWENIIDNNAKMELKMFLDELPKRKKSIIQRRQDVKYNNSFSGAGSTNSSICSLPTQYLSTSSLAEDIVKFDMSEWNINDGPTERVYDSLYSVDLEEDILNKHECMTPLCELINFIVQNGISPLPNLEEKECPDMPLWMECLRESLKIYYTKQKRNIVIFILKLIHNCKNIFFPYIHRWLSLIIDCLTYLNEINYFVADIIVMLLKSKSSNKDKSANNKLLFLLLSRIDHEKTNVRSYQLELINAVIDLWIENIDPPCNELLDLMKMNKNEQLEVCLSVSKRFLLKGVIPFTRQNKTEYISTLMVLIQCDFKRNNILLVFQILALILRVTDQKEDIMSLAEHEKLEKKLADNLHGLKSDTVKVKTDLFFLCLHHTLLYYDKLLGKFSNYLLNNFSKFQGEIKIKCLKILSKDVNQLPQDVFSLLMQQQFLYCLRGSDHELLKSSLVIIKSLVNQIYEEELVEFLPDIMRLSSHVSVECRDLVYDIAANIYLLYKNKTDERHTKIKTQCKAILLNGLLDNDSKLQENNFSFWKDKIELGEPVAARFINIIRELYSPLCESHFVSYAADYLLEGCSLTPDFESKIFDNPLGDCTFEDYKIISSWRRNQSLAPMFVNSIANQLITMSQSSEFGNTSFFIRSTQNSLFFQPTINAQGIKDSSLSYSSNHSQTNHSSWNINDGTTVQPSAVLTMYKADEQSFALKKLERRLQPDMAKASGYYASLNIKRREQRKILLFEQNERREKQIIFHRNYRTGNYPDVEIPRSAIILPLKVLAKRDPLIAKLIFISVFEGVLDKTVNKKNYLQLVNNALNNILQFSSQHDSIFIETLFEIAFNHSSDIHLDSQQVVVSSHSSGLLSLGTLLLENVVCNKLSSENIHVAKKFKVDPISENDTWMQLAELYKALDENDVVNGILKEKLVNNTFTQLKQGLEYEQIGNWSTAYNIYHDEVKNLSQKLQSSDEHFILEAYFNCAAHLSKWKDMNDIVKQKFQNLNSLWNETWNVEHTLPWFFSSEAYLCAVNTERSDYVAENGIVNSWLQEEEKRTTLINLIAEQVSILLLLEGENTRSYCLINDSILASLEEWNHSKLSKDRFSKVQTLSEIDTMLSIIDVRNEECFANKVNSMLASWQHNAPRRNNLIWWDKRTVYRLLFAAKYAELLSEDEDASNLKQLNEFKYNSCLHIFEVAVDEKNYEVAKKYLMEAAKMDDGAHFCISDDLKSRFSLNHSKMLLLQAMKCDPTEKMESFVECLQILEENNFVKNDLYDYHIHLANVIFRIIEDSSLFLSQKVSKVELMSKIRIVLKKFYLNDSNIFDELRETILWAYQMAANIGEKNEYPYSKISMAYVTMAKHCRQFLQLDDTDPAREENYEQGTIRSILRAMKFNSNEAQILFPTLLQLKHIKEKASKNIFISESEEVEEWKFLPWIQQLLTHLDTDIMPVIESIIIRITNKYPGALQFSLFAYSNKIENPKRHSLALSKLQDTINLNLNLRELVKALTNIRTPEAYFKNWAQKLYKLYTNMRTNDSMNELHKESVNFGKELESLSDFAYSGELFTKHNLRKSALKCIAAIQKNILKKELIHLALKEFGGEIEAEERRVRNLEVHNREYANRKLLVTYSPRLLSFADRGVSDIEIPGQYNGFSCPDSNRHVKIYDFDKRVEVQNSKQKPIKITIIGSNAEKYSYLVKFEEDLRQDQRVQQIFTIMNRCNSSELENSKKYSVMTYEVFPLTSDFGIIQWIDNTIPLRDFADYGQTTETKRENESKREKLIESYHILLEREYCKQSRVPEVLVYEEATKKHNETHIISSFQNISKEIPEDVFRKSLLALCHSPTIYWSLRNQFIISYSIMCIYGWILGIGDRHLGNTLVCLKTGNCIAIDFGYAFGSGIECIPIPELIPFRMTPHIQSVMAPFYLTGLIRETMINALQILNEHEYILFSTLQIFILEPSLNWLSNAKKKVQEQDNNNLIDLQWHPINKINTVKRKLHGVNPVKILIEEVSKNEIIKEKYREACIRLLKKETRMKFGNDNLNPTEQVECLLDLAIDQCILGLSWKGLETYI